MPSEVLNSKLSFRILESPELQQIIFLLERNSAGVDTPRNTTQYINTLIF